MNDNSNRFDGRALSLQSVEVEPGGITKNGNNKFTAKTWVNNEVDGTRWTVLITIVDSKNKDRSKSNQIDLTKLSEADRARIIALLSK